MPKSITVSELKRLLAEGRSVPVLDVRRAPAFEEHPQLVPGAQRVLPEAVAAWAPPPGAPAEVVVYCVLGQQVSQCAAQELEGRGIAVRYLEGGIAQWEAEGGSTVAVAPGELTTRRGRD